MPEDGRDRYEHRASLRRTFATNPIAWTLAVLLAMSVYAHHKTGAEFRRVCETIAMLQDGYFDIETALSFKATGIDLGALVANAHNHERLMRQKTAVLIMGGGNKLVFLKNRVVIDQRNQIHEMITYDVFSQSSSKRESL